MIYWVFPVYHCFKHYWSKLLSLRHTDSHGAEVALWYPVVLFPPFDRYNLVPLLVPFASLVHEAMLVPIQAGMLWEILCSLSFIEPVHVDLWRHTVHLWPSIEQRLPNLLFRNTCGGKKKSNLPFDMYYKKTDLVRKSLWAYVHKIKMCCISVFLWGLARENWFIVGVVYSPEHRENWNSRLRPGKGFKIRVNA